jgi:hypothetical protein
MPTVLNFCYLHYTRVREVVAPLGDVVHFMCKGPDPVAHIRQHHHQVVGPLVDPFRSPTSRTLFNGVPWFLLHFGL